MKKTIIFVGLLSLLAGFWWFKNYRKLGELSIAQKITDPISLNFASTPKEIKNISCWVFNYPIYSKKTIDPKLNPILVLENGKSQTLMCDALIEDTWWPILWSVNVKNIEGDYILTKAIKFDDMIVNVNSLTLNNKNHIIITSSSNNISSASGTIIHGNYKISQLPSQPIEEEVFLCENCLEPNRNHNTYTINTINFNQESKIESSLISVWHNEQLYKMCGSVWGITSKEIEKNTGQSLNALNLERFIWDPNFKDGWIFENAVALRDLYNCTFNNAQEQWQCEQNLGKENFELKKGELCKKSSNESTKEQCYYEYFINEIFPTAETCVERPFINLGGKNAKLKMPYPTAKGLSFVQRGIWLDNQTLTFSRISNVIKPTFINQQSIPCNNTVYMNGVIRLLSNNKILFYIQLRTVNSDHKQSCINSAPEKPTLNTMFIGESE